ncbi:hypothetical protein BGZ96_004037, partial [Linnemannia gamsii]
SSSNNNNSSNSNRVSSRDSSRDSKTSKPNSSSNRVSSNSNSCINNSSKFTISKCNSKSSNNFKPSNNNNSSSSSSSSSRPSSSSSRSSNSNSWPSSSNKFISSNINRSSSSNNSSSNNNNNNNKLSNNKFSNNKHNNSNNNSNNKLNNNKPNNKLNNSSSSNNNNNKISNNIINSNYSSSSSSFSNNSYSNSSIPNNTSDILHSIRVWPIGPMPRWNNKAHLIWTFHRMDPTLRPCYNQSIQSWQAFVNRFYSNEGRQKYTLVNPTNKECKTFEIPVTSLPKLYHTNYQSGVKEMKLTLDGTIEQPSKAPLIVECDKVSLLSDYTGGSKVMSVGSVRVMFATDYKIDLLEITISDFTELIPRPKDDTSESPVIDPKTDSKKKNASKKAAAAAAKNANYSVPESVVNEFGVTHKTMRTLGISDIKSKMPELMGSGTGANKRSPDTSLAFNFQGLQNGAVAVKPDMPGLPPVTSTTSTGPPTQAPFVTFGTMPQTDGSHILAGLSSPGIMKRRFSTSLVTIAGGVVGPGTMQSPSMEATQSGTISAVGTPTMDYASVGGLATHLNNVQGPGGPHGGFVNVSGSFTIPSGVSMASIAPPTAAPPTPNVSKSIKRAKNASVASTPILSNKGTAAGGVTPTTTTTTTTAGRSRKGTGRKDSSAKRKGSLASETAAVEATTGSLTPTIPSTAETGSPTARPTAQFRNRPTKNIGSPVSIPSPVSTPMMSVALTDVQQANNINNTNANTNANVNQVPGGLPVANLRGMSIGFEAMSPPFYSALAPNQTMLMSTSGAGNLDMDTTFQIPRTAMDDSEEWTGALDFMTDPKGLDMNEFIFDPSYDKEPEPTGSNPNGLTSKDTASGTQISL